MVADIEAQKVGFYGGVYRMATEDLANFLKKDDGILAFTTIAQICFLSVYIYLGWFIIDLAQNRLHFLISENPTSGKNPTPYLAGAIMTWCIGVNRSSFSRRYTATIYLDAYMRLLIRALFRISRDNNLPIRSQRRKAVDAHVRLVAALLQKKMREIDSDPPRVSAEIAEIALQICERYSHGRFSSLLEESQLAGVSPIHDAGWIRLLAATTLTTAAAVAISFAGLPDAVIPMAIGGIALLIFTGIIGNKTPKALDLLDSMRGIQRP